MPQQAFDAAVSDWVRHAEQRLAAVFRESTARVVREMQTVGPSIANPSGGEGGNMPVDTGFLRSSIQASTQAPIPIDPGAIPSEGQKFPYDATAIELTIAGAALGQTVYVTYTAAYAAEANYGTSKRPGYAFVDMAAMKWPMIVSVVCNDLQSSVEGSTPGT